MISKEENGSEPPSNKGCDDKSNDSQEKKTAHHVSVTPSAWKEAKDRARECGCTGISDLVEKFGRHELNLVNEVTPTQIEALQLRIEELEQQLNVQMSDLKKIIQDFLLQTLPSMLIHRPLPSFEEQTPIDQHEEYQNGVELPK